VQELLNNAIKHSEAKNIYINTRFSPNNKLMISVTDNGSGFELKEKMVTGLGLKNLESRTQIMDAKFKMKSTPGKGTTAIIYLDSN
jgi:signal transduction histidine kinase